MKSRNYWTVCEREFQASNSDSPLPDCFVGKAGSRRSVLIDDDSDWQEEKGVTCSEEG